MFHNGTIPPACLAYRQAGGSNAGRVPVALRRSPYFLTDHNERNHPLLRKEGGFE